MPRPLKSGAEVGLFALSGPVAPDRLEAGIRILEAAGFRVAEARNARNRTGYLAGSDDERVAGVVDLLDRGVEALVAVRGGYGVPRVLDRLPWEKLGRWGGWVAGFSDVTALHAGLATRSPYATLHGPMATTLARHGPSARRAVAWLRGEARPPLYRLVPSQVVRGGRARGVSAGGNLSILSSLVGTGYEPDYDGAVLFVEDVGEPLYRVDRMLTHLRLASRLDRVAAIVAGQCVRCGRGEHDRRGRLRALLAEAAPASAVVLEGVPFGHGRANLPFPLGVEVEVDTDRRLVSFGG